MLQQPVVILDEFHRVLAASKPFCLLVGATHQGATGRALLDVGGGLFNVAGLKEFLDLAESGSARATGYRLAMDKSLLGRRTFVLHAQRIPAAPPNGMLLVAIEEDVQSTLEHESQNKTTLVANQRQLQIPTSITTINHDLRQPLQTLSLLQGLMAVKEKDPDLYRLVAQLEEAIEAVTGMLNAAASVEQLNAGSISPEILTFPIGLVINRLRAELAYHAEARGLEWRVVRCVVAVRSDSRLLGQVIRALLLNAMKLIRRGKVLFGCRRRGGMLVLQIWINGAGLSAEQQQAILDEFHRHNGSSTRTSSVDVLVKPLSDLLRLNVKARTRTGNGLLFTAELPIESHLVETAMRHSEPSRGAVLVSSDDPSIRETLMLLMREIGHETMTTTADDGFANLVPNKNKIGSIRPEIVIVDSNDSIEPGASKIVSSLRWMLGWEIPAIVLVDDASKSRGNADISEPRVYLPKPVRPGDLVLQISRLLAIVRRRAAGSNRHNHEAVPQTVFVVDDDGVLRDAVREVLGLQGQNVELFSNSESFLDIYGRERRGCLVVDNKLPGMSGVELLERLKSEGSTLPSVMITGHGDISTAIRALKAGAIDYIEKPISYEALLTAVESALEIDRASADALVKRQGLAARIAELTPRERQVMDLVVGGRSSKKIAQMLNISQRTVENHRAAIMKRAGAASLPDLIRIVMQLGLPDDR